MVVLVKGERLWCWWMSRYLWYDGKVKDGYKFHDVADVEFIFSEEQVNKLFIGN